MSQLDEAQINQESNLSSKRVAGLDAIRLICALWVVFGHFGFIPLVSRIDKSDLAGKLIVGFYNNLISGPAAVIVFFVISGFCINYPYRQNQKLSLLPYYSRRYIRILTPMIFAILLAAPLGIKLGLMHDSILWSLLAEEIYYAIFPLLLLSKKHTGWLPLLLIAFVCAVFVVMKNPTAGDYPSYGPYLNWLLGLPCWLLGCQLAEGIDRLKNIDASSRSIWWWRGGAWALSIVCSALRFHSPLKYPWTLNLFAIFVFFWLRKEIARYRDRRPLALLEKNGKWSYSIYLMHLHGQAVFLLLGLSFGVGMLDWAVQTGFILVVCYLFYLLIEKPSHLMARKFAGWMSMIIRPQSISEPITQGNEAST
jgi:peptidoglycan/LPS O-acetylase OafA/YrhL